MYKAIILFLFSIFLFLRCSTPKKVPVSIDFKYETLMRIGGRGDNWCMTWLANDSKFTSMCDGDWLAQGTGYHNNIYRIIGEKNNFSIEDVPSYPKFSLNGEGWFGYGIYSVEGNIYSFVSRTQNDRWSGPFRGMKLLKSSDDGRTWYRINHLGEDRLINPFDEEGKESVGFEDMFFWEEGGITDKGKTAFPFSYCTFVQNGKDNQLAKDKYVYIYSPEGARSNNLLLARVKADEIEFRNKWEFFSGWNSERKNPIWSKDLNQRQPAHIFPEKNKYDEFFGWYSWLPSVVWNPELKLYIMVNGGTYAGKSLSLSDYYDSWMHTNTGSLGFWYSKNPYGPWEEFFYTDYWIVDDDNNRTYQPKLSPKWIDKNGTRMVLVWSDAMKDEKGRSHTINYRWNQMEIVINLK